MKKGVGPLPPKKSKRADLRNYSTLFFFIGLNIVLAAVYYAFDFKTIYYDYTQNGTSSAAVSIPNDANTESEERVLVIDPEEIENIVNTEAFTHAVWPGYKGKITDGQKVRNHFAKNLAAVILRSGGVEVRSTYRVHFYYVVRDDGAIQFLSLVGGGKTTPNTPKYLIERAQQLVNIGVPGIKSGTDANGDPITVVYELTIKFIPNE